jgi:hypothetical protein
MAPVAELLDAFWPGRRINLFDEWCRPGRPAGRLGT